MEPTVEYNSDETPLCSNCLGTLNHPQSLNESKNALRFSCRMCGIEDSTSYEMFDQMSDDRAVWIYRLQAKRTNNTETKRYHDMADALRELLGQRDLDIPDTEFSHTVDVTRKTLRKLDDVIPGAFKFGTNIDPSPDKRDNQMFRVRITEEEISEVNEIVDVQPEPMEEE